MIDSAGLLAAYDSQLRTDAETPGALSVTRQGPLRLVTFSSGRGFITYQDLGGADADAIRRMVAEALAHFQADPSISRVEWKTRGHDRAPGLHETLLAHGFTPDEPESIMVGDARALAVDVPLPDGVTLRRITEEADIRAMIAMQDEVFGNGRGGDEMLQSTLRRLARGDELELWVAEADGAVDQRRADRPGAGDRLRRDLGRRDPAGVARPRDLPGADGRAGPVGAADGQEVHQQRLDRVLAPDPRTVRPGQGLDHDAVQLGSGLGRRGCGCRRPLRRLRRGGAGGLARCRWR